MMKPAHTTIRIPEPRHEDWNRMTPDDKGKFCEVCSKSVIDFSNKSDLQIRQILREHQNQKICGHVRRSQLDRPLSQTNVAAYPATSMTLARAFTIVVFLAFGSLLFSCKDHQGNEVRVEPVTFPQMQTYLQQQQVLGGIAADSLVPADILAEGVAGELPSEMQGSVAEVTETVDGAIEVYDPEPMVVAADSVVPPIDRVVVGIMAYDRVVRPEEADTTSATARAGTEPSALMAAQALSIFPNPGSGQFTIAYEVKHRADVSLVIFDINGAMVRSVSSVQRQYEGKYRIPVDLHELPNGVYIVQFICAGERSTERLVLSR